MNIRPNNITSLNTQQTLNYMGVLLLLPLMMVCQTTHPKAGLIVMEQDIFSVTTHTIAKAKILLTLFQGRKVYGSWSE